MSIFVASYEFLGFLNHSIHTSVQEVRRFTKDIILLKYFNSYEMSLITFCISGLSEILINDRK